MQDVLYIFQEEWEIGTATLEENMAQNISVIKGIILF